MSASAKLKTFSLEWWQSSRFPFSGDAPKERDRERDEGDSDAASGKRQCIEKLQNVLILLELKLLRLCNAG